MKAPLYTALTLTLVFASIAVSNGSAQSDRTVYVSVESSRTEFVKGLRAEDFKLFENGSEVRVTGFNASPEPVSVGFLFDVSGSILAAGRKDVNEAAQSMYELVQSQERNAEFFLLGFNKEFRLLSEWTSDAKKIASGLAQLSTLQTRSNKNITAVHAALIEGLAKVQKGRFMKKALVVFSDGHDSSEDSRAKELIRSAQESDTLIYFVSITEPNPPVFTMGAGSGRGLIDDLTIATGGKQFSAPSTLPENRARVFVSNPDSRIRYAFQDVFRDLAAQYALRFTPSTGAKDHDARNLNVKVTIPAELKKGAGTITVRYRKKFRIWN